MLEVFSGVISDELSNQYLAHDQSMMRQSKPTGSVIAVLATEQITKGQIQDDII